MSKSNIKKSKENLGSSDTPKESRSRTYTSPAASRVEIPIPPGNHLEFECGHIYDCETWQEPEFIYDAPFIAVYRDEPGMFMSTAYNTQLSAFYRGTNAEQSLKKNIPKLIEKVIEKRTQGNRSGEFEHYSSFLEDVSYNICTNQEFEKFDETYVDAKQWNDAIADQECKLPLMTRFGFTEAYAHAKIHEATDFLTDSKDLDYHAEVKQEMISNPIAQEAMYVAASRFFEKVPPGGAIAEGQQNLTGEADKKRKEEFMSLLQFCLWANKNNKALISGEKLDVKTTDPFQYMDVNKIKIIADDSGKIYDGTINKAKAMRKTLETTAGADPLKQTCSCHRLAKVAGVPICEHEKKKEETPKEGEKKDEKSEGEQEEAKRMIACPTKVTAPNSVTFDIICENAGMELFAVMCFAHFLIARNIVDKVRFHVKKIPWYETHATSQDIMNLIEFCKKSTLAKYVPPLPPPTPVVTAKKGKKKGKKQEPPPPPPEEPPPPPPDADKNAQPLLQILGQKWSEFIQEGRFIIANDFFWTSPYTYKQMKSKAPWLYRTLQLAGIGAMFIGDVNYRRLLNETRVLENSPFEAALQGFNPAPIIAVRNINCEILCGLGGGKKKKRKKKGNQPLQINPEWLSTDNFGVIQYYAKADTSKTQERPCAFYGIECRGGAAQLVQVGISSRSKGAGGADAEGGTAMLNVCEATTKGDNLCG